MAVVDMPVHHKTILAAGAKYACHNKDRRDPLNQPGYWARDGLIVDEISGEAKYKMVFVKNVMSTECRYDGNDRHDERCAGCTHFLESEYVKSVQKSAKQ